MPTDAGAQIGEILAANLDFVARYYRRPSSHWPSLSASEARLLSSAGLRLAVVWEAASTTVGYFTRLTGVDDSTSAYAQAHAIGQPGGSAIYFAVDFDATAPQIAGPVSDYFNGIASGFAAAGGDPPDFQVGVYGSGAVCQALMDAGLAQYFWLAVSTAWAGHGAFSAWNIKQGKPLAALAFGHDSDEATADFGGFQIAQG